MVEHLDSELTVNAGHIITVTNISDKWFMEVGVNEQIKANRNETEVNR